MSIFTVITTSIGAIAIYIALKLDNAIDRHRDVLWAMLMYCCDNMSQLEDEDIEKLCDSLEPLKSTMMRGWEWSGYKNLVTPETYEKIKDYL